MLLVENSSNHHYQDKVYKGLFLDWIVIVGIIVVVVMTISLLMWKACEKT